MLGGMSVRSCRVTVTDMEGVDHTCVVTAGSLYEAVARGLVSLRRQEWVGGVVLEHGAVKLQEFNKWVRKDGGSPRDVIQRGRVREILGIPATAT
jgi:hypothetical protein